MHSKAQGLMASLLMFIPLLAVPFVASFGVPWLAAKAKDEGLPVPDVSGPSLLKSGVGHSQTGKHSAEDLFAPLSTQAAVDLRLASQTSPATVQNPHLRNASLVITHNDGWVDPFENLKTSPLQKETVASEPPEPTPPEDPLGGWGLKDEATAFPADDAPKPREFFESETQAPSKFSNPFQEFEANASVPMKTSETQVAVSDHAFEDPIAKPRVNTNPNDFDPSRPLFAQSDGAPSPKAPKPDGTMAPDALPAKVSANTGNTVQESPTGPLTWEAARVRLQELGVKKYYVQQNANGQIYHFRCAYAPPDNPRVIRLFEAEAAEPLEAVRKVLVQLEGWKDRESASAE